MLIKEANNPFYFLIKRVAKFHLWKHKVDKTTPTLTKIILNYSDAFALDTHKLAAIFSNKTGGASIERSVAKIQKFLKSRTKEADRYPV